MKPESPKAIRALDGRLPTKGTTYPESFASLMKGREKRALGEGFGLNNFGVNITRLAPGAMSALRHSHTRQDEFVAGTGDGHHLVNRTREEVLYLEVGDRSAGDAVTYPDDDLKAELGPEGRWRYRRKDGKPY